MNNKEKILKIMIDHPNKVMWYAKDFQQGEFFIGYEASARMSEVQEEYKDVVISGKDGRYRTLSIDWSKEKEINDIKTIFEEIGDGNTN